MDETTQEEAQKTDKKAEASAPEDENVVDLNAEAEGVGKDEEACQEEEDYKSKFYYVAAEMENLRKRIERERTDFIKYGNEKILRGLIEVVDNFDRTLLALQNDEEEKVKNIVVGINMVRDQFLQVLKENGLEPIEALGKEFDPNFHEAMTQQKDETKENGQILSEFQKGYLLNGRLLRASKVIVCKND